MKNSNKISLIVSVAFGAAIAVFVSVLMAIGAEFIPSIMGLVQPRDSEMHFWDMVPLIVFGGAVALLAERFDFKRFAGLTAVFFVVWFLVSAAAARFLEVDFLFIPLLLISILSLVGIQLKKVSEIESKLTRKLTSLTSGGHLIEGKNANARLESGLQLLQTVLPLAEVIVFQYEEDGTLNPVGRSRNENVNDSLSSRQNSWRNNVALCEKALRMSETVVETNSGSEGAARIALPLITENTLVGGLFVDIKENYERNDIYLLEAFSEQLARNFQRRQLLQRSTGHDSWGDALSTQSQKSRIDIVDLVNGLIKEQSFGVVATSYLKEAHTIAYLDGTIAYVNRQMRKLASLRPGEVQDIDLFDLLDRFKTDVFNDPSIAIRKVLQTGSTFQSELIFPDDDVSLDLEITLVKVATDIEQVHETEVPKKPACFLITLRDIRTLKENEKLRSDMVNLVSHELRTPITSIHGFAEMLMNDQTISEDSREYLSIIANESQRAANLLTNFLSVAGLQQSDKQEFHKTPVRVNKVVNEVVEDLNSIAKRKRIRLVEKHEEYIPPIAADRGLITKALSHLIDNAVKYSPERTSVIISTILESDFLRVEIEDRGYGIPAAEQEKIWQKFYRVSREGQDKENESTGLGLALVKEIIERHSGTINVESEVGRGSKFCLRIPRL